MDFLHLRSFVAVAEELSFRRAAERLHVSQPPLSRRIQALEEEIGVCLLERDRRRRICHTEAGKSFLTYARQALSAAVAARSRAQDAARNAQGQLKLGNMPVLPRQSLAYAGFELPAHGRVSTARYSGSCLWPTTTSRDSARTPFFTTSRAGLGISRGCPRIQLAFSIVRAT